MWPSAGALEATSLGAYGPLFDSSYVFNASYAQQVLNASSIVFPNTRIAQGAPSLASSAGFPAASASKLHDLRTHVLPPNPYLH